MGELVGGTTIGGYTALHSGLKEAYLGGNLTFAKDKRIIFSPNSTWGSTLSLGGNGHNSGAEQASVATTDGNLHLDAANTNGIYLNYYTGTNGIYFGNGASGAVARMTSAGDLGLGTTAPAFRLDVNGTARITGAMTMGIGNTNGIKGYAGRDILVDHNNANVTLSATGGGLYLGYTNTTVVRLHSNLTANDGTTKIADTTGALYYKGQDTDVRYILAGSAVGNADTLDNLDSTQFLRSDVSSTMKGKITNDVTRIGTAGAKHLLNELYISGSASTDPIEHLVLRFHQSGKWWHRIEANNAGFYFRTGDTNSDALSNIYANAVHEAGTALSSKYLGISAKAVDSDKLVGVDGGLYMRRDVDVAIYGKQAPGNTSSRAAGMYGIYDSYKIGHVWSMGAAYAIPADGSTFGTLYGIAYKHTNNTTGGTMAGGHQIVITQNGVAGVALGMGGHVWTSGNFYSEGGYFYMNGKEALQSTDTWLRVNDSAAFSSGTYFGSNIVRTDGQLQVGGNGVGFLATQSETTIGSGNLKVSKSGYYSTITFPAQTNDPAYIKHYENNNTAVMYFSVSDDKTSTDYFAFGSTPSGTWSEGARIRSDGYAHFVGLDLGSLVIRESSGGRLHVGTPSGWGSMGPENTSWCHIRTDRANFYFEKPLLVAGYRIGGYGSYTNLMHTNLSSSNTYLRVGNYGDGSGGLDTEVSLTSEGQTDMWGSIGTSGNRFYRMFAGAFSTSSSKHIKKNIRNARIEKFKYADGTERSALEVVKGLTPYRYNFYNKADGHEDMMGVMLEEGPKDILDSDELNIDLYKYSTMLLMALQELTDKVEHLEGQLRTQAKFKEYGPQADNDNLHKGFKGQGIPMEKRKAMANLRGWELYESGAIMSEKFNQYDGGANHVETPVTVLNENEGSKE